VFTESESITVRAPRPGDRIRPFGMDGSKKLSDVFIDKKVPRRERERCVVVEADGEILWVPGVVAAEATRVHGVEASIQLTARREEGRA
jgi:tRNA(Ile)-lysidine synthetase-like protein